MHSGRVLGVESVHLCANANPFVFGETLLSQFRSLVSPCLVSSRPLSFARSDGESTDDCRLGCTQSSCAREHRFAGTICDLVDSTVRTLTPESTGKWHRWRRWQSALLAERLRRAEAVARRRRSYRGQYRKFSELYKLQHSLTSCRGRSPYVDNVDTNAAM